EFPAAGGLGGALLHLARAVRGRRAVLELSGPLRALQPGRHGWALVRRAGRRGPARLGGTGPAAPGGPGPARPARLLLRSYCLTGCWLGRGLAVTVRGGLG